MARAKGLSGLNPLAYMGVEPSTPSNVILEKRRPTVNDYANFNIGTWWLWVDDQEVWILISKESGVASWIQLYPGAGSGTSTFITDAGSANEVGGDINVSGGTNINTAGAGDVVTVNLNSSINLAGTIITAGNITSGDTVTSSEVVTGSDITCGGTLTAATGVDITAGGIDSTGTTRFRDFGAGVLQSDATGTTTSSNGTNGQVLVGGGTDPSWANITSTGGTVTITEGANSINLEQAGGPVGANVAFMAYLSIAEETVDIDPLTPYDFYPGSQVIWTEDFDLANAFFPGDGAGNGCYFKTPIAGKYCFTFNVKTRAYRLKPYAYNGFLTVIIKSNLRTFYDFPKEYGSSHTSSLTVTLNLVLNEEVNFYINSSTDPAIDNLIRLSIKGTRSGMIKSYIHGYMVD